MANHKKQSSGRNIFNIINFVVLTVLTSLCIIPLINAIAISFSEKAYVAAGLVTLWPKGFSFYSYGYLLQRKAFWQAFNVSVVRTILGTALNLVMILLTAYPLSKESSRIRFRTIYVWFFFVTLLIGGGIIPSYLLVARLGLRNTLLALILPGALPIFNLVLMINFFRQIPKELEEAAIIDGAGNLYTLVRIYIPCSMAAIATISLFCMVGHWNAWFDGLIYITSPDLKPLQTYLRMVVLELDMTKISMADMEQLKMLSDKGLRATQVVVSMIPILAAYPFLQRYFVKGIVLGSVKG
ncbi:protein LplC [Spirochaetia bacterium]|nr:protein LplC [Spirochaetia bacterium]